MGDNRVASVDDPGIIAAFIEHAHLDAEHVGDIYGAVCSALVRTHHHEVIAVQPDVRYVSEQSLDKLICSLYRLETMERNGVLHTGIMGVEGDDIVYAHIGQLLKSQRAVQGLSGGTLMLTAFIKEGHDHSESFRFAAACGDDTF